MLNSTALKKISNKTSSPLSYLGFITLENQDRKVN